MRKKAKKLTTTFLSLLLLMMCILGNGVQVNAEGNHVIITDPEIYVLVPGETKRVKIPIKAVGDLIEKPTVMADNMDAPFTLSQPELVADGFDSAPNRITPYDVQYIEVDIKVAETAKIGVYPFKLLISGRSYSMDGLVNVSTTLTINTQIMEEKQPPQLTINKVTVDNPTIGRDMNLSFTVKNEGEITARNIFLSIDYADTGMVAGYTTKNVKIENIGKQKEEPVRLPVKILSTATPGLKTLKINLDYKIEDGTEFKETHEVYINIKDNNNAPDLVFEEFSYDKNAKQGDPLGLVINIRNSGRTTAINPKVSVDESSLGTAKFIKDFYTDYIELVDIKAYQTAKVKVPLLMSKDITRGVKEIKLNLVYFDEQGVEYKKEVSIYPEIEAEGISEDGSPVVIISNVKQVPEKPVAGEKLVVSFDIENKSAIDLNEFKIGLKNLNGNTFIPIESDPYQYIGTLNAGTTQRVTIPLTISKSIPAGLNTLSLAYSYAGGGDSVDIPVLDVQNDLGSASKPRLIVSKYETDVDELRAGSVFNFNFEIRNTHSSVAAKNIIISVSGKAPGGQSEIFTVTQGNNSFFVSKIDAGETFSGTLEMKVKSDTATSAYPIYVTIEYEYDGIEPNPTTGKIGEVEDHELNLQVVENARPVVDSVQVYSWDYSEVKVGNPATLYFEFYNMGKSMLNNVIATVEGDFTSSGGDMKFLGNVQAGETSFTEFEVIPNVEGTAKGVIKITYEDSNGDEQVYTKDFEQMVMGAEVWDPGFDEGGMDVFNPILPEPKKAILPVWAFVLVEVAIFVLFIPITRKIIISVYKSRLRKKDEEFI